MIRTGCCNFGDPTCCWQSIIESSLGTLVIIRNWQCHNSCRNQVGMCLKSFPMMYTERWWQFLNPWVSGSASFGPMSPPGSWVKLIAHCEAWGTSISDQSQESFRANTLVTEDWAGWWFRSWQWWPLLLPRTATRVRHELTPTWLGSGCEEQAGADLRGNLKGDGG